MVLALETDFAFEAALVSVDLDFSLLSLDLLSLALLFLAADSFVFKSLAEVSLSLALLSLDLVFLGLLVFAVEDLVVDAFVSFVLDAALVDVVFFFSSGFLVANFFSFSEVSFAFTEVAFFCEVAMGKILNE